jgi:hypothetical protein
MSDNPQGRNIGSAVATIRVVVQGLAAAKGQLVTGAASMKTAFESVTRTFTNMDREGKKTFEGLADGAEKAAAETEKYENAVARAKITVLGLSAAAAGIVAGGVAAARSLDATNKSLLIMTGSAKGVEKVMSDTRALAKDFNVPYMELLRGAQSFLPIAQRTNIAVTDLQKTLIKIQAIAPGRTLGDVRFAMSEALSGDFVSIKDMINLSKAQRDILKEVSDKEGASGVNRELNKMIEQMGFGDEVIRQMGQSGVNAFALLGDSINELMATAFLPFFQNVVLPGVQHFTNFVISLNNIDPGLVQLAVGFTVATAAIAPLVVGINQLVGAYTALKTVTMATNLAGPLAMAGKAAKLAGVGIAAAGGVALGVGTAEWLAKQDYQKVNQKNFGGVQGLDLSTDDLDRIKGGEKAMDVLGERLKQLLVIVVDQLIYFGETLAKIVLHVTNAIDQFINVFELGGAMLGVIFASLKRSIADLMVGIADALAPIMQSGGLRNAGLKLQGEADWEKGVAANKAAELAGELTRGFQPKPEDMASVEATFANLRQSVVGGLSDMLFPAQEMIEETVANVEATVNKAKKIVFEGDQVEAFIDFQEDLADLTKEGNKRRLDEEEAQKQRELDLIARYEEQRARAIAQQQRQEGKDRVALEKQINKMIADSAESDKKAELADEEKAKEVREKSRENLEKAEKDHLERMADLQTEHRWNLVQAMSKLDARAVWAELNSYEERKKAEEDGYATRKADLETQLNEELEQIRTSRAQQREEQAAALAEQIQDQRDALVERHALQREEMMYQFQQQDIQRQEEMARLQQQGIERMAQLDQQLASERQRREQAFIEQFNSLAKTEEQKLAVQRMGQATALALLEQYWKDHNAVFKRNQVNTDVYKKAPTQGPPQGPQPNPNPGQPTPPRRGPVIGPGGVSYFHTGGRSHNTGPHVLQKDEEVLQAQIARQLRSMMGGEINQQALVKMFGEGGRNVIQVDNVNNHFGDIGNRSQRQTSEDVTQAVMDALLRLLGKG